MPLTMQEHEELTEKLYIAVETGDAAKVEEFFNGEGKDYVFPKVAFSDNEWDYETTENFEDAVTHFLHLPEERRNPDVLVSLVRHGAEMNYREDQNSILQYTFVMDHPEIVPELFNAGATLYEDVSPDKEEPLTTAVLDGSDEYFEALLKYGDLKNCPYSNSDLLELGDPNLPFAAAVERHNPKRFAQLAVAFNVCPEARVAVTDPFVNPGDRSLYYAALDETGKSQALPVKVFIPELNKYEQLKVEPSDENRTINYFYEAFTSDPAVKMLRDEKLDIYFSMPSSKFWNYEALACQLSEANTLINAVRKEMGAQSPEMLMLNRELDRLNNSAMAITFTEQCTRRNDIARRTAFRVLETDKLHELGFQPDDKIAFWAAKNGKFDKVMEFEWLSEISKTTALMTELARNPDNAKGLRHMLEPRDWRITDMVTEDRSTLLINAVQANNKAGVDILLEYGASVNPMGVLNTNRLPNEKTIEGTAFTAAVMENADPEIIKSLLKAGVAPWLGFGKEGPIHYAIDNCTAETMEALLDGLPLGKWEDILKTNSEDFIKHAAATKNKDGAAVAKILLDAGAPHDEFDENGFVPLHLAIQNTDNPDVAKVFIDRWLKDGYSLLEQDNSSCTFIEHAVDANSPEVFQYMIDKEPRLLDKLQEMKANEQTFGKERHAVLDAVYKPNIPEWWELRDLATQSAMRHFFTNADEKYPETNFQTIRSLLSKEYEWYRKEREYKKIENNDKPAIEFHYKGSDLEKQYGLKPWGPYADYTTKDFVTHINEFIQTRLEVYDQVITDYRKQLKNWLENTQTDDSRNLSPEERQAENVRRLHAAATVGDVQEIITLVEKGVDINARDRNGLTPLYDAVIARQDEAARTLIFAGAETEVKDNTGCTPLHCAARLGHVGAINILITGGADTSSQNLDGYTPLYIAVKHNQVKAIGTLLDGIATEVNLPDMRGVTPLHEAVKSCPLSTVNMLIAAGADVNARDDDGRTPLHYAAANLDAEITRTLINAGADVDAQAKDGMTPLCNAVGEYNMDVAYLLRRHGASLTTGMPEMDSFIKGFFAKEEVYNFVNEMKMIANSPKHLQREQVADAVSKLSYEACVELTKPRYKGVFDREGGAHFESIIDGCVRVQMTTEIMRQADRDSSKAAGAKITDVKEREISSRRDNSMEI